MSTVANETLTDDRDRKYFLDSHREPGNGYKCCTWPLCLPTLFIPVISIAQIAVQIAYAYQHTTSPSRYISLMVGGGHKIALTHFCFIAEEKNITF